MKSFRMLAALTLSLLLASLASAVLGASERAGVTIVDAAAVHAAFLRGVPLLETPAYKVHASRREAAGAAEVHTRDTDTFYVLEGSAELVTGGTMKNAKEVAPGEIRADAIEGGTTREIRAGEVVVIPNGVPHWFRRVDAPVVYYVVKVTSEIARE